MGDRRHAGDADGQGDGGTALHAHAALGRAPDRGHAERRGDGPADAARAAAAAAAGEPVTAAEALRVG